MSKTKKSILTVFAILLILVLGVFLFIILYFRPTPKSLRNNKAGDVHIEATVYGDERTPIIRTYTREKFESFNERKIKKLNDTIGGKVEGDISCINLNYKDKNYVTIKFFKENELVTPEKIEAIITSHPNHYNDKNGPKEIISELKKDEDGSYRLYLNRYHNQYEKWFLEYEVVKLQYKIGGKDYVSIFSTYVSNAKEGTDFFDNVELNEPIPPENN